MSKTGLQKDGLAAADGVISHIRCADCAIRTRAVCSRADPAMLAELDRIKSYRSFEPGREIIGAGEATGFVGSIVDGVVKLTRSLPDGRRQMVGLLFPGDFVGHVLRDLAEYDAIAATEVTLCLFRRAPFEALVRDTPALQGRLLEMKIDELDAAQEWLLLLGRKTAREKVASFLLALARRAGKGRLGAEQALRLPLTRAEIAEYLGLTIETVSRQMTRLREDGLIAFDGLRDLRVPDPQRLASEAGD